MIASRSSDLEASFDVIVVGAGHAGTEAAVAAARCGASVAIVTSALETIGQMSCNPAIGGVAKGTVVREVDALGRHHGARDRPGVAPVSHAEPQQGASGVGAARAVRPRAVSSRRRDAARGACVACMTIQGTVARLLHRRATAAPSLASRRSKADASARRCVVITTGTFLRGRIHIGTETKIAGGRAGESAATHLAEQLERVGLAVERFKTGTPPRIDGRSVDFSRLERQESEIEAVRLLVVALLADAAANRRLATRHPEQMPCWITFLGAAGKADHPGEHRAIGDVRRRDRVARSAVLSVGRGQDRRSFRPRSGISCFSSPRGTTRPSSTSTGCRRRCPRPCSSRCCTRFPDSRTCG